MTSKRGKGWHLLGGWRCWVGLRLWGFAMEVERLADRIDPPPRHFDKANPWWNTNDGRSLEQRIADARR
jgi:hypothetical protein